MDNRRVVVTGMGAVTPLGETLAETWQGLVEGRNAIAPITEFDTSDYKAKLAAEVKNFDPLKYMEKLEAGRTDRYAQLAIAASQMAVDDSNILGTVDPTRFAVYIGNGIGGIHTIESEYRKLIEKGPRRVSPLFVPMLIANMAAGLIAIRFNCQGQAMPSVTACASGTTAIGEAVRLIRHNYADAVIAGGTEASITPSAVAGFTNMQALSTSENINEASLPFDKRRNGFVMGEGSAVLILEELEHAKKRGAKIYGEICGYGSSTDAYHMTSPHPKAEGAVQALKMALEEAGYNSDDKIYFNAHGTGTHLNDISETLAIKRTFGEEKSKEIHISSTKSMTGHMLGAAGAIEAVASIMALNENIIPPTINLLEKDEECDLDYTPNKAVKAEISMAVSNSLGFGGHNACLVFRRV